MGTLELKDLLNRYNSGQCTSDEKSLIESWYLKLDMKVPELTDVQTQEIMDLQVPRPEEQIGTRLRWWIPAAAAIFLISLAAIFYWPKSFVKEPAVFVMKNDVSPGSDKAILSLSNGKKILLDEAKAGPLITQKNMLVRKRADGSIDYTPQQNGQLGTDTNIKNTISTPRGGQYRLTLSDGTKVWLNAVSSITYPISFSSANREVEITGEVYFEVSHTGTAFLVRSKDQLVEVLGTHFNINAYQDEPQPKTTLLEGSVRVKIAGKSRILRPGEQAVVSGSDMSIISVDPEAETAWKEGDFVFAAQPLKDIMRNIARWYDVEVNYDEYTERNNTFSGVISRSRNLSALLKMMEKTRNVKFRIEGKQLYVIN